MAVTPLSGHLSGSRPLQVAETRVRHGAIGISAAGYRALRDALRLRDAVPGERFEMVVAEWRDRLTRDGEEAENFGQHRRLARVSTHPCAEGHADKPITGIKGCAGRAPDVEAAFVRGLTAEWDAA